jgi:hypothetical protein
VAEFSGFHQVAFGNQLQPVGNVIVHWALPLTIGVATGQAAVRLISRFTGIKGVINFNKLTDTALHIALWWVNSLYIEKLKLVV